MRIDLHVHASERSACSQSCEVDILRAAGERRLSGIAFTDHGRLVPAQHLAELRRAAPCRIYTGIEVCAGGEDLLVLGMHDSELERPDWTYPELRRFVAARGGCLVLAHPLRYHDGVDAAIRAEPPDAVEAASNNMRDCDPRAVRRLIDELGCRPVTNSDAHHADTVGAFFNEFDRLPADDAELVRMLKAGQFRPASTP